LGRKKTAGVLSLEIITLEKLLDRGKNIRGKKSNYWAMTGSSDAQTLVMGRMLFVDKKEDRGGGERWTGPCDGMSPHL